jgi:hypothetical protein
MSDPENFLSRWSRRKLDAERPTDEPPRAEETRPPDAPSAAAPAQESADQVRPGKSEKHDQRDEQDAETLDLSTLPSLESITAETDVRVFLQKGVPAELTRAALRRAWVADPSIRDFIEVAENQWDFATGSDLPGFGPLELSKDEIRRMVADAFGEPRVPAELETTAGSKAETLAETSISAPEHPPGPSVRQETTAAGEDQPPPHAPSVPPAEDVVQRNEVDIAMQHSNRESEYERLPIRRPHGRALPQ